MKDLTTGGTRHQGNGHGLKSRAYPYLAALFVAGINALPL